MIYLHQSTPTVYTNESRDFQLLCRLYDVIENGVKYNINSVADVIDTQSCDILLLQLLQTKVGFFTSKQFSDDTLRPVLEAFPYLMKNKGSKKAIKQAVNLFLKINKLRTSSLIEIINSKNNSSQFQLRVGIGTTYVDPSLLTEIFNFIIPSGYNIYYYFYKETEMDPTMLIYNENIQFVILNEQESAQVVDLDFGQLDSYIGISDVYTNPELSDTVNVVNGYFNGTDFYSDSGHTKKLVPAGRSNTILFRDLNYTLGKKLYIYDNNVYKIVKPRLRVKVPKKTKNNIEITIKVMFNNGIIYDGYEFSEDDYYVDENSKLIQYEIYVDKVKQGDTKLLAITDVNPTIYYNETA